ncbi:hypothetical protein GSI_04445 [Ganoderma sinense ZZ0214-1]|uniref:DUF4218 domain-containing protein n=1 Tax=Ganoderma sinense ZZ0214-1 TaxID=1077348 RepID=A0A2G8SJ95_9APHY|nr:hypothetical protein GSI_04445 [Ganoderma sinense ZZ0214-1]
MDKPSKVLCTCSKCTEHTVFDSGQEHNGRFLRPKTALQHRENDIWTQRVRDDQQETEISSTILLASASDQPSTRRLNSPLPVRPRDLVIGNVDTSQGSLDREKETSSEDLSRMHGPLVETGGMSHVFPEPLGGRSDVDNSGGSELHGGSASSSQAAGPPTAELVGRRLRVLSELQSSVDKMCRLVPNYAKLAFNAVPTSFDEPVPHPSTPGFGTLYTWLQDQTRYVSEDLVPIGDRGMDQTRLALLRRLTLEIERLEGLKEKAWAEHLVTHIIRTQMPDTDEKGPLLIKTSKYKGASYAATLEPFVLAGLLMAVVLHSLAATARIPAQYVLQVLKVVLHGAFMFCNSSFGRAVTSLTPEQDDILRRLPADITTVIEKLGLEPDFVRFACCPTCDSTYSPDPEKPGDPYPHTCSFRETDKPVCGTPLVYPKGRTLKGKKEVAYEAFKIFPFRSPTSWLADFLSRPGMRKLLNNSWIQKEVLEGVVRDILDSDAVRSFPGPDGKTPFSLQPNDSLHLVFSLFVDWFNPFGNKKAGKSHSVGVVYLALNNLPGHLRYRAENMCLVAVIPGPHEPELHRLNHFLRPLVDDLIILWHRGIHLSDTSVEGGLLFVRAALIPLVCDVPALRKTGGFAGHMSTHFCSLCELPKADINELDREKWTRHNRAQHLRYAARWCDAKTEAAREAEFKLHGIRWSELLRLDYWDPTRFAVVDAMHNLFLGELRHHCRDVWGLDIKDKGGDGPQVEPHTPEQQRAQLDRIRSALLGGHRNPLDKVRKGYIVAVAQLNGVLPKEGNIVKQAYVDALLIWAKNKSVIKLPPVLDEPTTDFHGPGDAGALSKSRIIDRETIEHIRRDIVATQFPSWMERPPRNFGSPSHGKLKADQWRTVCTVSLVITLCRLWGVRSAPDERKRLLENFVHLVCAVDLATRRSMSPERITRFDGHIREYLSSLRTLFNHSLVPNHHLSLHLHEFLRSFGPVHGWWTFPFERFNGLLARLNTNSRSEHMALTFIKYFYIGANLRGLFMSYEWPDTSVFKSMMNAFNEAFSTFSSGTRIGDFQPYELTSGRPCVADYNEKKEEALPPAVYSKLVTLLSSPTAPFSSTHSPVRLHPILNDQVNYVPRVQHGGVTFATRRSGMRDSFIVFDGSSQGDPSRTFPRAGQITDIFLHGRTENGNPILQYFAVVEEYVPLRESDVVKDPYRKFPDLQTRLFYRRSRPSPHVIALDTIRAHFAALFYKPDDIDEECVAVRSLDRD